MLIRYLLFTPVDFVSYILCLHYNLKIDRMWYDYSPLLLSCVCVCSQESSLLHG